MESNLKFAKVVALPEDVSAVSAGIPIQGYLTPPQVVAAYNIPQIPGGLVTIGSNISNVKIGIFSIGGSWLPSDFDKSMANLGLSIRSSNITTKLIDNAANVFTNDYSFENSLDLYCVGSVVPTANITIYIGNVSNVSFGSTEYKNRWANVLNSAIADNCDVISISYAIDEIFGLGPFLESSLANAAAKGITVLAATGDQESEGNQPLGIVSATYPATSPNIIAVGGTSLTLTNTGNIRASETVYPSSNSGGPAGGVSTLFSVPSWQNNLSYTTYPGNITQMLTTGILSANPLIGRSVPDISAAYGPYVFWYNSNISGGAGTSASCPIIAGILGRVISLNGGRRPPPLTLNSILYSHPSSLNKSTGNANLTVGNNAIGNVPGYSATSSWDPVTGLGVPNGNIFYQTITGAGIDIKNNTQWAPVKKVYVRKEFSWANPGVSWVEVNKVWTKTSTGWKQVY